VSNVAYDKTTEWSEALAERKRLDAPDGTGIVPPAPPTNVEQMSDRIYRLEGAFDWIKVSITIVSAVALGGIAFVGIQINRFDSRMSAVSDKLDGRITILGDKVDVLPDKINANLRDITNSLAQAITASK